MLVLGLLLIAGAALITVGALVDGGETATVEVLGQTLTTTAAGVFVIGAVTMLVFMLGVWALMASMKRSRRKRSQRKQARAQHRDSVRSLEDERTSLREENERLNRELAERERSGVGAGTAGAAGAGAGAMAASGRHDSTHDRDRDGVDDRTEHTGHRSLMDRVTGRHDSSDSRDSHDSRDSWPAGSTGDTGRTDSSGSTTSDSSQAYGNESYGDDRGAGHRDDRVIDQNTDLRSSDSTTSSHRRDA